MKIIATALCILLASFAQLTTQIRVRSSNEHVFQVSSSHLDPLRLEETNKFLGNEENTQGKSFTITLDKVPCEKAKARSLLRSGIRSKKIRSQDGTKEAEIPLQNHHNFDYIGKFHVGNPPQEMRACFDTGSANGWILSSDCNSRRCQPGSKNQYFDPRESSSFQNTSKWTTIQFGSGKLRGYFGKDDFRVGGGDNQIHVRQQTLGLIVEEHLLDADYDAIIGLAYPTMANVGAPLFDSMIQQNLLNRNLFAFYMATDPNDQSELTFGTYDRTKFVGDITWHPVIDKLFWSLRLDDIEYNGVPLNICKDKPNGCMITPDSGTSLITAPSWAMNKIHQVLPQVEKCNSKYNLGTLTFVINNQRYDVPSHHFMETFNHVYTHGDQYCLTTISALDIQQPRQENLFIVGDAFMQLYYSIFDRDNDQVGLANSKIYQSEKELSSVDYGIINNALVKQAQDVKIRAERSTQKI